MSRKTLADAAVTFLRAQGWKMSTRRPCAASIIDMLEGETAFALEARSIPACAKAREKAKAAWRKREDWLDNLEAYHAETHTMFDGGQRP